MILSKKNVFNENELNELQNLIDDFVIEYVPTMEIRRNDYYKQQVFLSETIINKVNSIIAELTTKKVTINSIWLNKIDPNDNIQDDYHVDDTDLSFVIYPNKNFDGGELEYIIDKKPESIEIDGNSIIMILHKTRHRVKRVYNGVRWSIALFCFYNKTELI